MSIKVGDWIIVTKRAEDEMDMHYESTEDKPKYLYEIGSGGKVIHITEHDDPLVEFYWGKYNYQQENYKYQAEEQGIKNAKGGWYVCRYCLTVLPPNLTIKQMRALGKVMT
jgi:hypothetical protein